MGKKSRAVHERISFVPVCFGNTPRMRWHWGKEMKEEKGPALQGWVCVGIGERQRDCTCKGPEVGKTLGVFAEQKESPRHWDR